MGGLYNRPYLNLNGRLFTSDGTTETSATGTHFCRLIRWQHSWECSPRMALRVHVVRSWCVCFLGDDSTLITSQVLSHQYLRLRYWHEFCRRTSSVSLACFQLMFLMFLLTFVSLASLSLASLRSAAEYPLYSFTSVSGLLLCSFTSVSGILLCSRGQVVVRPVAKVE